MDKEQLNKLYTIDKIKILGNTYFIKWAENGWLKNSDSILKILNNKPKKENYIDILYQFFNDKEVFDFIESKLSEEVRTVFFISVWKNGIKVKELENEYKINILSEGKIKSEYAFFDIERYNYGSEYIINLPKLVQMKLKEIMEIPEYLKLKTVEEVDTKYRGNYEEEFIQNIEYYRESVKNNIIKKGANDQLLKASLKQFKDYANYEEFYNNSENKELELIKTDIIANLFVKEIIKEEKKNIVEKKELLKDFSEGFFSGSGYCNGKKYYYYDDLESYTLNLLKLLVPEVKPDSRTFENLKQVGTNLKWTLEEMNQYGWLSIENIYRYTVIKERLIFPYNNDDIDVVVLKEKDSRGKIVDINYVHDLKRQEECMYIPFFRGVMLVAATLGMVEIAYDNVKLEENRCSGVKYVKLTDLGRFLVGLKNEVEIKESNKNPFEVELSRISLSMNLNGGNIVDRISVERIAEKIADDKYVMTYNSLFKECGTKSEIIKKIAEFKEKIKKELPDNWKEFFKKFEDRKTPYEIETETVVLKLEEKSDIVEIVVKDEEIKKLVLRAEGYRVIIQRKNMTKFYKLLEKYGYFCR